jgi:hypothetical protein
MDLQIDSSSSRAPTALWDYNERPDLMKDVVLRHLKTPAERAAILHLREEIDLSALAGDAGFVTLEKKETSAASSSVSTCAANS